MPSFSHGEEQLALLRIIRLRQAVLTNRIQQEPLERIAKLSTAELDLASKRQDTDLQQLTALLTEETMFISSSSLQASFTWFDQQDFLALRPLATESLPTITTHLHTFAQTYLLFGQYISIDNTTTDTAENMADINQPALTAACTSLQRGASENMQANPVHSRADTGLPLANEWLNDHHIQHGIDMFGLSPLGAHIIAPFSAQNLGHILSIEHQRHLVTAPTERYAIPLIINNNQRIDTQGTHWTSLLIIVTPGTNANPTTITANYTDSMSVNTLQATTINTIIQDALNQNIEHDDSARQAEPAPELLFPRNTELQIDIKGTQQQTDSYSCGYHALQQLLKGLQRHTLLPQPKPQTQDFIQSKDNTALYSSYYQAYSATFNTTQQTPSLMLKNEATAAVIDTAATIADISAIHSSPSGESTLNQPELPNVGAQKTPLTKKEKQPQQEENDNEKFNRYIQKNITRQSANQPAAKV